VLSVRMPRLPTASAGRALMGAFHRGLTFSTSACGRCCAARAPTAVSRAVRATASLLFRGAELIAGSVDTRTDIQQASGFLLAQESVAACDGVS
jgi:hypothetical protein